MLIATVLLAGTAFSALGCGEDARIHAPAAPSFRSAEVGLASWYGHPYHGRRASNGEIYNMNRFTAAHRSLPFGTRVRVRNPRNGKTVVVRITDRGPFLRGRVIDLSRAAARAVGMLGAGLIRVQVEILAVPGMASEAGCTRQEGSLESRLNLARFERRIGWCDGHNLRELPENNTVVWRIQPGLQARSKMADTVPHPRYMQEGDTRRESLVVSLDA